MKGTLLNTRPQHQACQLTQLARQAGFAVVECPCLEIVYEAPRDLDLGAFDVVVFVSRNAVQGLAQLAPRWSGQQLVAVGAATAQALDELNWPNRQPLPPSFDSEGMLQLAVFAKVPHLRVLIVRGDGGRELLADSLRQAGARVSVCEVYRRQVAPFCQQAWAAFRVARHPVLLFTSQTSLAAFLSALPPNQQAWCLSLPLIVFSERIAHAARERGFSGEMLVTPTSSDEAIISSLTKLANRRENHE
ncbi:MAG: uroporphyrinogen-III synthase [Thiomicrospira sp.]|jgi:uroporphyrinogen-III synthase|nr:uroporphyrinogen-III synthase [Thiomicrospira sp.]